LPKSGGASAGSAIELTKRKLKAGERVQIVSGLPAGRRGRLCRHGVASTHQAIKVLLQLLGAARQA
jgi:hypothetical protein